MIIHLDNSSEIQLALDRINSISKTAFKVNIQVLGENMRCQMRGISWIHWKINKRTNEKRNYR